MDSKLLTIIVPTYNRSVLLKRALTALLPTVATHKDYVNVHISDNASTDDTRDVVNRFIQKYPDVVTYRCQEENLGAQLNFRDAARRAQSRYVALLSDDDIVTPHYVSTILDVLQRHPEVSYVNANMLYVRDTGDKIFGVRDTVFNSGLCKYYETGADFLKEHSIAPTLVSSNVFRREEFNRIIEPIEIGTYPGYEWYAAMCFSIVDSPCYYIDFPLLIQTVPAEQRWSKNSSLYTIRGLGRIYSEIDKNHPGVFDAWRIAFLDSFFSKESLISIAKNKEYYQGLYTNMIEYAVSTGYAKLIRIYTYYPLYVANLVVSIYSKLSKYKSYLKK